MIWRPFVEHGCVADCRVQQKTVDRSETSTDGIAVSTRKTARQLGRQRSISQRNDAKRNRVNSKADGNVGTSYTAEIKAEADKLAYRVSSRSR